MNKMQMDIKCKLHQNAYSIEEEDGDETQWRETYYHLSIQKGYQV